MHYRSLVARPKRKPPTSHRWLARSSCRKYHHAFSSILFFSVGFLVALHIKSIMNSLWPDQDVAPFVCGTPGPAGMSYTCRSSFIAFGTGMMMLTFTGEPHRKSPLCDLYDFWKLPQSATTTCTNHSRKRERLDSIGIRRPRITGLSLELLLQELVA